MAGFEGCIGEVIAAAGGAMSRAEAQRVLEGLDARASRTGGDLGQAARDLGDEARMAAMIEKRNALINLQARQGRRARIVDVAHQITPDGKPLNIAKAMENQVVAIHTPADGSRMSAEARGKERLKQYVKALDRDLSKAGLTQAVRSGRYEAEWGRELYELSMQAADEPGAKPGATGSKIGKQIADIVHRYQSLAKENLNRAGAWVGDYAGYITSTVHDADKIRRAGTEAWVGSIRDKLDLARTFEGEDNPERVLRKVWADLVTGVHLDDGGPVGFKDPAFTGPGNMAKAASAGRTLHFKDAESWLAYQREFGTGSLFEQTNRALERSARRENLMATWGTNPRAEFQQDFQWLRERFHESDPQAVLDLDAARHRIETQFSYLDGTANMPANKWLAKFMGGARAVKSMASLGGVMLTHLTVGGTGAAELRYHGVPLHEGYTNFITSIFKGRGRTPEERELADLTLAGLEGMHGDILSRFTLDDSVPGTVSKLSNVFFKWGGLTYLLDAEKTGKVRIMARHLGMVADREHGALEPETQRLLRLYNISPGEWDALRTAPGHLAVDGRVHLTPDAAQRASPESIYRIMGGGQGELPELGSPASVRAEAKARDELGLKLQALLSDIADRSIVTPGIAEKAMIYQGNRPGTLWGEALRSVAQFKLWGLAAARQGFYGRELRGGQGAAGAAAGVFHMATSAAVLGYAVMTLKDFFTGKDPRPLDSIKTWEAALMQGGGFGILGDFLFGEYGRTGGDFATTALGPVAGDTLGHVIEIYNDLKAQADDPKGRRRTDAAAQAVRLGESWAPFINMFYIRMLTQYLLVHQVQEWLSPGYLRRMERRAKQDRGQTYWLSPSTGQARLPVLLGGGGGGGGTP